jgi:tetratricopeptide (TPR) repeat protein
LGLNRDLAATVASRSGGNPQFAVQLVGDWVQKGLLEVGPSGFQMRSGVRPEIPADLQAMWERRLTAVISSDRDVRGLELAARMGLEVEAETWQAACSVAGLTPDWELVDQLLSAQLAMAGSTFRSWRFSHYLLADALRRRADFGGRARGHHAAAAQVLLSRGVALELPRLGRHQAGAGQLDAATATLLAGAKGCVSRAEWNSAWALLREREEILSKLGVPHSDGRWADGWLLRAESVRVGSDLDVCVSMYRKVLASVGEAAPQAAQAWVGLGREARIRGDHRSAREFLERADQLYSGPELGRVPLLIQLAILEAVLGATNRAKEVYSEALGIATAADDGDSIQDVQYHMAALFRRLGDEASARAALASVHDWCEAQGRRERVAQCANDMAEMDRLHGDMDAAIEGYRKSLRLYEAVGARQAYVARINLGIIAAERGHTVEAREHLGLVVPMLQRMKLRGIEGLAHLVMALVEAHDERWEACELALSQGVAQLKQTSFVDLDVARALEQTGEVALSAGKVDCARTALELSAEYWEVLEREEAAARVADLLAEIHQIS